MLNNTEYNNMVICVCPKEFTPEQCYVLLANGFVSFPNIRVLARNCYAMACHEIDKLARAYNQLMVELRDDRMLTDAERTELQEVAYDEFYDNIEACRLEWHDRLTPDEERLAFNL